jgi:hypothetical protein
MASIALTSIGCIISLALGTVLTRAMLRRRQRERKLDLFFSAKKAQDVRRGEVLGHATPSKSLPGACGVF